MRKFDIHDAAATMYRNGILLEQANQLYSKALTVRHFKPLHAAYSKYVLVYKSVKMEMDDTKDVEEHKQRYEKMNKLMRTKPSYKTNKMLDHLFDVVESFSDTLFAQMQKSGYFFQIGAKTKKSLGQNALMNIYPNGEEDDE